MDFDSLSPSFLLIFLPLPVSFLCLSLLSGCDVFYFPAGSDEVLLKITLVSLIHTNAHNRMEIDLLS